MANPASDNIMVALMGETAVRANLSLTDSRGQQVFSKTIADINYFIDTSNLANGLYLLSVKSDDGQTISKKVIIQH